LPAGARQDLRRLLPALACPACHTALRLMRQRLVCVEGHAYPIDRLGMPAFLEDQHAAGRQIAEEDAAAHAALHAFAPQALGRGEAEGLYRTVSDLLLRTPKPASIRWMLDLGCGPGRTLTDAATAFPRAIVAGVDRSVGALTLAFAISRLRGPAVEVDLRRWGFGALTLPAYGLRNVFLARAAAEHLPFAPHERWPGFDVITCVNLLDRTADPEQALREAARVARPGGRLVLTTPLNWRGRTSGRWQSLGSIGQLCNALKTVGFAVDLAFDGLVYREILDARGSLTDWRVAVVSARRRQG
jgi:SAM-dependent methyltransferase